MARTTRAVAAAARARRGLDGELGIGPRALAQVLEALELAGRDAREELPGPLLVDGSVRSLYSVFGDADDHFVINATAPFFHVPPPFGSHFGGVNPQFDQYCPTCAYDSFLTVGITDGDAKNQLSQIGLEWNSFDKGQSFGTDDGMVFWMNPDKVHH